MNDRKSSLEKRLSAHPELKKRIEKLLEIVEDADDDIVSADRAEEIVINEIQRLGNELMHDWATHKESSKKDTYSKKKTGKRQCKKK